MNAQVAAATYIKLGFGLVHIPRGEKRPSGDAWQNNPVNDFTKISVFAKGDNIGLLHSASGTAVLDVDAPDLAAIALKAVGINLQELLSAPAPLIKTPNSLKPIYRVPEGLELKRHALAFKNEHGKNISIFELRAGATQDVLPPSLHPSGVAYVWENGLPLNREDIPLLPGGLRTLWENWAELKPMLEAASPRYVPPKAKPHHKVSETGEGSESIIASFNSRSDLRERLFAHGYRQTTKDRDRFIAPGSSTGVPGVIIFKAEDGLERCYSHHGSDPLAGEHSHDAFSVYTILEHCGDTSAAVKAAARELGLEPKSNAPKQGSPPKVPPQKQTPLLTRMSDVEPEPVDWLWPPYLPLGKLTLLEGDPGLGKTFIALAIAAAITRGWPLLGQDGFPGDDLEPGDVIYMSAEDGLGDTLRPRLDAAGADVSRVHALTGWQDEGGKDFAVTLAHDDLLAAVLEQVRPRLIVIDPLQAYLGAGVDMHRANETRPLLSKLGKLAEKYGCAVLIIRHFNKGATKAIYAGAGSIDFTAAARSVLQVGEHEGERLLAHAKSSLAPMGKAIRYGFEDASLVWLGVTDEVSADDLRQMPMQRRDEGDREGALEDAKTFLRDFLAKEAQPARQVETEAKREGISAATLRRAKKDLGIISSRKSAEGDERGSGSWVWNLPVFGKTPHTSTDEHLERLEENSVGDGTVQDVSTCSPEPLEHIEDLRQVQQNVQGVQDVQPMALEATTEGEL